MKIINIGLIGFGNIGSGLYNLLMKNSDLITKRTGIDVKIKSICDIKVNHVKERVNNIPVTDKWEDIVNDKEIDIVIELIGGLEPAKTIILSSLHNGKSVVTANKKLLAEEGTEIFQAANSKKSKLEFEASVGGGIPCILSLKYGLVGNRFKSIMGILNGTTNYILSKMEDMDMSFNDALKEAQIRGFAEADPTFDIEGYDTGHKISLLSMIAFNKNIDYKAIPIEGITKINKIDISYAKDMGYVIKLLGIAKSIKDDLDIRVHPTMLPEKHPLASVRDEFNAVLFDCDMADHIILYGKGAGSSPTASAVLSDIIQIVEKDCVREEAIISNGNANLILEGKRESRYYIRIHTEDKPGILSKISGVFGMHNISISSVIQKEVDKKYIPLIIMTHKAQEDGMLQAINEIKNFNFIHEDVMVIRVED